jgi:subtilisin-like proprotein convertase family protein
MFTLFCVLQGVPATDMVETSGGIKLLSNGIRKLLTVALACAINATPATIYTSTDVPKGIAGSSLTSTLNVPDSFLLTDVNVSVNIAVFAADDHVISLTSPGGTTVEMFNANCGTFGIIMTFDDEAASSISSCSGFDGEDGLSFQPLNPLSAFDGEDAQGTWTLSVAMNDTFFAEDTSLNGWSITVPERNHQYPNLPHSHSRERH